MQSEERNDELESLRAEALALFQANQSGRNAAERVATLLSAAVGLLVAAGVSAETDDVAIAFPPIALVLLSYMFQQYADVRSPGPRAGCSRRGCEPTSTTTV